MGNLLCFVAFMVLFAIAIIHYQKQNENDHTGVNRCTMTYMWRRMQYMDVGLKDSHYSLLLYGEGNYADYFRENHFLNGIPILFVPGNAGSGRQVRSLGSLLQNKTEQRMTPFHFDTFALDFSEELTALDFDSIKKQSIFLLKAIQWIWSMYSIKPKGIILIGHSMGGIVIQSALMNAELDRKKIAFVLSFSTPYAEPPFYFEKRFMQLWNKMNATDLSSQIKIISLSGGLKDEFIEESWTKAHYLTAHYYTSALDHVWLDMDHKCILWCNELVRQTSRLLFEYASDSTFFIQNFDKYLKIHYESIGSHFEPLQGNHFSLHSIQSENGIIAKYNQNQIILLNNSNSNDQSFGEILFAISSHSSGGQLLNLEGCESHEAPTRYLDKFNFFAFANLTKCLLSKGNIKIRPHTKYWIINEKLILKSTIKLGISSYFIGQNLHRYSMANVPITIIPIHFYHPYYCGKTFYIYRVQINRKHCKKAKSPKRVFFMENNRIRRVDELRKQGEDNQKTSILIYSTSGNTEMDEYKMVIIDTGECAEHLLEFSLDIRSSLIRAIRLNRHIIPASVALSLMSLCLFSRSFFHGSLIPVLMAFTFRIFSDSFDAVFVLLCGVISLSALYFFSICILRRLLNISKILEAKTVEYRWLSRSQDLIHLFLPLFVIYTRQTTFGAVFCALKNLMRFNEVFKGNLVFASIASLQLIHCLIQAPALITYCFRAINHRELRSTFDPFLEANCLMLGLTFFLFYSRILGQFPWKLPIDLYIFSQICNFILFFIALLVFYRNPLCIFVMDDLSLLVALFLIYFYSSVI